MAGRLFCRSPTTPATIRIDYARRGSRVESFGRGFVNNRIEPPVAVTRQENPALSGKAASRQREMPILRGDPERVSPASTHRLLQWSPRVGRIRVQPGPPRCKQPLHRPHRRSSQQYAGEVAQRLHEIVNALVKTRGCSVDSRHLHLTKGEPSGSPLRFKATGPGFG